MNAVIYNKAARYKAAGFDAFEDRCTHAQRVNVYSQLRRLGWRMVVKQTTSMYVYFEAVRINPVNSNKQ